jgi:ABC-type multidrug transport system fused ATPase/permease subunit
MIANILVQVLVPLSISKVMSGIEIRSAFAIYLSLGLVAVLVVSQKVMHYGQAICREHILSHNQGNLDDYITEKMFEKSIGQHTEHSAELNVSNIDKGRWRFLDLQNIILYEGFSTSLTLLVSIIMLCVFSLTAGLIMSAAIFCNVFWTLFLNHRVVAECSEIEKRWKRLNRRRTERWTKVVRVKTSGKAEEEIREMHDEFVSIRRDDLRFWTWFIWQAALRDIGNALSFVGVISYGAWVVYNGFQNMSMLFPLIMWAGIVINNIWQIGRIEHLVNWNMPSVRSKIQALAIPPDVVDVDDAHVVPANSPIAIKFDNVSYLYPTKGNPDAPHALRNVSFTALPGEKVAIIGPSGAGKSTIIKLLLREMDPTSGSVNVNNVDLRRIKLVSWMRALGYIPQTPQIFDGTIKYNLTYALSPEQLARISDDEIWRMMVDLQIDYGKRLTQGMYTRVGYDGIELSGGQNQRLSIGAAAMKRPLVMLIDEATSSLDSMTERMVQDGLARVLHEGVTAIIIAHRLSTIRNCSKFVVLRSADNVGEGESQVEAIANSFEELYPISPTFRILADNQQIQINV